MPERLTVDQVDLPSLILARNDTHPEGDWWFDPRTGESLYYGTDDDADLPALVAGVHVLIAREPQPRDDIDDFLAEAPALGVDAATLERLWDASRGKGGTKRFRSVVARTAAAEAWSRFTLERETARAVSWLEGRGLIHARQDRPDR